MIEQTLKKERIMLSETKYAGLCVLGMEVFYVLCLAYGLLLTGKSRELHQSLFELLPWFAWGNPRALYGVRCCSEFSL